MVGVGKLLQIKLASVKLAMKYLKRVSAELETVGGGPDEEELIVQCVRFAFRVHQVMFGLHLGYDIPLHFFFTCIPYISSSHALLHVHIWIHIYKPQIKHETMLILPLIKPASYFF